MSSPNQILSPSISNILFFKPETPALDPAAIDTFLQDLPVRLGLQKKSGLNQQVIFQGQYEDFVIEISGSFAYDTVLVRVSISIPGSLPYENWQRLSDQAQTLLNDLMQNNKTRVPWGVTQLFQARLPNSGSDISLNHFPMSIADSLSAQPDPSPYGWLWVLNEANEQLLPGIDTWRRSLALLIPEERFEKVNEYFLAPLSQGLSRIELYLQKGKHHSHLQSISHDKLEGVRRSLQESMNRASVSAEFGKNTRDQQNLDAISLNLMRFTTQVASQEILLNSLQANRAALKEHLELMKLDIPIYRKELLQMDHHMEQLSADIRNARTILESTSSFQEIHRGVETIRLERASVLMGAAAALLAGVAVFNSFLDIWNLALEGSGLIRPSAGLRIMLGFITGVSLPLAATWFVEKKVNRAVIAVITGILSVAAAIVATLLVNR